MEDYFSRSEIDKFENILTRIADTDGQKSFSASNIMTDFFKELIQEDEKGLKAWLDVVGLELMFKNNGGMIVTSKNFKR